MRIIPRIYNGISRASEWSGRTTSFLVPVLVLSIVYDVVARYVFTAPTIWSFALSFMLGATIIAVGMSYVYYHNANVRVDVIYSRLPLKGRVIIDVCLTFLFFLPLISMLTVVWARDTWQAYLIKEVSSETIWHPILWPFKLVITLSFALLLLQGIVTLVRDILSLRRGGVSTW